MFRRLFDVCLHLLVMGGTTIFLITACAHEAAAARADLSIAWPAAVADAPAGVGASEAEELAEWIDAVEAGCVAFVPFADGKNAVGLVHEERELSAVTTALREDLPTALDWIGDAASLVPAGRVATLATGSRRFGKAVQAVATVDQLASYAEVAQGRSGIADVIPFLGTWLRQRDVEAAIRDVTRIREAKFQSLVSELRGVVHHCRPIEIEFYERPWFFVLMSLGSAMFGVAVWLLRAHVAARPLVDRAVSVPPSPRSSYRRRRQ